MVPYKAPEYRETSFNCPHCFARAVHRWDSRVSANIGEGGYNTQIDVPDFATSYCTHCRRFSLWFKKRLIQPAVSTAPLPVADMPDDVLRDYEEARAVLEISPRASAALLRLALQRLCVHLGQPGKEINADIKALVAAGLPTKLQRALDIVRVTGNEAVHPGSIQFDDDAGAARPLFDILNMVVEEMITKPKEIDDIFAALPPDKLKGIDNRDKKPAGGKP